MTDLMDEEELVIAVQMSDVITLGMSQAEFAALGEEGQKKLLAEHLRDKPDDTTQTIYEMLVNQWIDSHEVIEVRNEKQHRCDCCEQEWSDEQLEYAFPDIPELGMRVEPGGTVPSGECPDPDCRALCYLIERDDQAQKEKQGG